MSNASSRFLVDFMSDNSSYISFTLDGAECFINESVLSGYIIIYDSMAMDIPYILDVYTSGKYGYVGHIELREKLARMLVFIKNNFNMFDMHLGSIITKIKTMCILYNGESALAYAKENNVAMKEVKKLWSTLMVSDSSTKIHIGDYGIKLSEYRYATLDTMIIWIGDDVDNVLNIEVVVDDDSVQARFAVNSIVLRAYLSYGVLDVKGIFKRGEHEYYFLIYCGALGNEVTLLYWNTKKNKVSVHICSDILSVFGAGDGDLVFKSTEVELERFPLTRILLEE